MIILTIIHNNDNNNNDDNNNNNKLAAPDWARRRRAGRALPESRGGIDLRAARRRGAARSWPVMSVESRR